MARKKIREYEAKQIIAENIEDIKVNSTLVSEKTIIEELPSKYPGLLTSSLVIKPDMLFGKRKKLGLVKVNIDWNEVKDYLNQFRNKEFSIDKTKDILTHFLIEPYIEHQEEYYLAIKSEREHDTIYFSDKGGIDVEENWDNVVKIEIPTLNEINEANFQEKIIIKDENNKELIINFITNLFNLFREKNFTYLELNPFTIINNQIHILDIVAHLDSRTYLNKQFPKEFGKQQFPEERIIEEVDTNSGASLKLTILNPQGKIWNILGGGGASIIYLDMINNLGFGDEIANYGEASGNPSLQESYQYAKAIIELMIKNNGKILFIVGGIANFTNVKKTFQGYIEALEEYSFQLKENNVKIFVRRGGPNWQEGLQLIKDVCDKVGLKAYVHGPETSMPGIIQIARDFL